MALVDQRVTLRNLDSQGYPVSEVHGPDSPSHKKQQRMSREFYYSIAKSRIVRPQTQQHQPEVATQDTFSAKESNQIPLKQFLEEQDTIEMPKLKAKHNLHKISLGCNTEELNSIVWTSDEARRKVAATLQDSWITSGFDSIAFSQHSS